MPIMLIPLEKPMADSPHKAPQNNGRNQYPPSCDAITCHNPGARIHVDLRPYGELSEAEKQKDRDNIRLLFAE